MEKFVILKTVDDVVAALGGPLLIGRRLGISGPAVNNWKKRETIPYRQVIPVMLALSGKGYVLSAKLLNIRGVSGAIFATVYQGADEPSVNASQKRQDSAQSDLELFETGNVAAE